MWNFRDGFGFRLLLGICILTGFICKALPLIALKPDCPTISIEQVSIIKPTCGQSNGSITGVSVQPADSKTSYAWLDSDNKIIGNTIDLTNIPAGIYRLRVTGNSGCTTPVTSLPVEVINANAIFISGKVVVTPSDCSINGSITGLTATNATSYQWLNLGTGKTFNSTSTADLTNIPPGSYTLTASNATCSATSNIYIVSPVTEMPTITMVTIKQPTCNNYAGDSIAVYFNLRLGHPPVQYSFFDPKGDQIVTGLLFPDVTTAHVTIKNLNHGQYSLYAAGTQANNCRVLLATYIIKEAFPLTIYTDSSQIINDKCNQHIGTIVPYIVGLTPPKPAASYTWIDQSTGKVISHFRDLERAGAGLYLFEVIDPYGCRDFVNFTLGNDSEVIVPPIASGTTLCLPGTVFIKVENPDTSAIFNLYKGANDTIPIASNTTGMFVRHVSQTTDFYLARKHGFCESARTKVTEVVVANINIPNTFTPNNDGFNDTWVITGLEKFPGADVSVFSRSGALLFHSINYATPFNGQYKEKDLPAGVYYYVIDVKQPICFGKIAGSLTIVR